MIRADRPPRPAIDSSDEYSSIDDPDEEADLIPNDPYPIVQGNAWLKNLNLVRTYVPGWTPIEGFRELIQNWYDGLVSANSHLSRRDVDIVYKETAAKRCWSAYPSARCVTSMHLLKCLGFVQYTRKDGGIRVVNFDVQLSPDVLYMGSSGKRSGKTGAFIGGHGEGLKTGVLALQRRDHCVTYLTGSRKWKFCFRSSRHERREHLAVKISPRRKTVLKEKGKWKAECDKGKSPARNNLPPTPYCFKDTIVEVQGRMLHEDYFNRWLEVCLPLITAGKSIDMISTEEGDLLLDEDHLGKIYLKGMLLPTGNKSSTGKPFRYGYNLVHGTTDRDRKRISNPREEAEAVYAVWRPAMLDKKHGKKMTEKYLSLLSDDDYKDIPDVCDAATNCDNEVASKLWKLLRSQGKNVFYYWSEETGRDEDVITNLLRRIPSKLTKALYDIFRKHNLIRSPAEQREWFFQRLVPAELTGPHNFRDSVVYLLKSCLALDEATADLKIQFVSGSSYGLAFMVDTESRILRVHEERLSFEYVHRTPDTRGSCDMAELLNSEKYKPSSSPFVCDHAIRGLVRDVFKDVFHSLLEANKAKDKTEHLNSKVELLLSTMLRAGKVEQQGKELSLEIADNSVSSFFRQDEPLYLTAHLETCWNTRDRYSRWLSKSGTKDCEYEPACPTRELLQDNGAIHFPLEDKFDYSQRWFFIVRKGVDDGFFSLPTALMQVKSPAVIAAEEAERIRLEEEQERIRLEKEQEKEQARQEKEKVDREREIAERNEQETRNQMTPEALLTPDLPPAGDSNSDVGYAPLSTLQSGSSLTSISPSESSLSPPNPSLCLSHTPSFESKQPSLVARQSPIAEADQEELPANEILPAESRRVLINDFLPQHQSLYALSEPLTHAVDKYNDKGGEISAGSFFEVDLELPSQDNIHAVLYVHELGRTALGVLMLVATKFHFIKDLPLLQQAATANPNELVFGFTDSQTAGSKEDAEMIALTAIKKIKAIPRRWNLKYDDQEAGGFHPDSIFRSIVPREERYYCRYALSRANPAGEAVLIAVMTPQIREEIIEGGSVFAIDLNVANGGLSPGFADAGFKILAGVSDGLDTTTETWRHNYPSIHRETLGELLETTKRGARLPQPFKSGQDRICVAMAPCDITTVETLRRTFAPAPHYFVLAFETASLSSNDGFMPGFSRLVLDLLSQGYTIQIKILDIKAYGIPASLVAKPTNLVLIASKDWTTRPWPAPRRELILSAQISDLRQVHIDPEHFDTPAQLSGTRRLVFNHTHVQLGRRKHWHPEEDRPLTVREIARAKGFKDLYRFSGHPEDQYLEVVEAFPPRVAERLARMVVGRDESGLDTGEDEERSRKRRRSGEREYEGRKRRMLSVESSSPEL